jgi:TonB family protein
MLFLSTVSSCSSMTLLRKMKKHQPLILSVPKPCSENWDKMTPNEKGRHCTSCSKTVIDFSKYTDKELFEFLSKTKESVCGRLSQYQVNRPIQVYQSDNNSLWQKLMWGTALATSLAACNHGSNDASQTKTEQLSKTDTGKKKLVNNNTQPKDNKHDSACHQEFIVGALSPPPNNGKNGSNTISDPMPQDMPKFKGDMNTYIAEHIEYPKAMIDKNIQGTVYVNFIIENSGAVSNVKILKGIAGGNELDSVAIKVIEGMPKWTPGKLNGKNVRTSFNLPIKFQLDSGTNSGPLR